MKYKVRRERRRGCREALYRLRWLGLLTAMIFGLILFGHGLWEGPSAYRVKLIPGALFCVAMLVYLIVRRPWK